MDRYKYLVWVPGNCASVRLALQLASDAAVLKVQHPLQTPPVLVFLGVTCKLFSSLQQSCAQKRVPEMCPA